MSEEHQVGGVDIVLARMDTHPEEFYGEEKKWAFIYKEYFRDVMTEIERGQLFEKLKKIRREEFNGRVLSTLVPPEPEQDIEAEEDDGDRWADSAISRMNPPRMRTKP